MTADHPATVGAPAPAVVMISLHTSPLAQPGSGDAGGLNVYVRQLALALRAQGHPLWILTRQDSPGQTPQPLIPTATPSDPAQAFPDGGPPAWVLPVPAGPAEPVDKRELQPWLPDFAANAHRVLLDAGALDPGRPVVVHSHYWLSGLAGLRLAEQLQAPLVHTMHTLAAVKRTQDPDAEEGPEREAGELELARRADLLIANTPAEAADLVEFTGASPDRIQIVPPGVDTSVFTPEGPRHWPGLDGALKLLFAGRVQSHKGPQIAVQALGVLENPDVVLHLTGAPSGTDHVDLEQLAQEFGVSDQISMSAPLSPEQLAATYRAADVVVMPSLSESFGLVALEAQACGTPVLAHRVGGLVHAVEDGVTGRLVADLDPRSWADSLQRIVADRSGWNALGPAAVSRAQGFGWDVMARHMSAQYSRLSAPAAPAAPAPR